MSAEEAPVAAEKDPAEQDTHADARLAPAFREYFPVPHAVQLALLIDPYCARYVPALQSKHLVCATAP